ncbi:MAG: metal ABC transporter permease, partial [Pseudomonadota bacterium]
EDTAIGAVLSVFFGAGVVLLTIIQSINAPGQAGLEGFLLGATAGMLFGDAVLIACGGALVAALLWLLRRPMTLVAFDPAYAAASGINVARIDLAMMGIALAVTVIGLKIVGLVLIIALLIIPAVAARFWSERIDTVVLGAGAIGAVSGYLGAAISASAPGLPTGPIVVLVAAAIFVISLLCAPARGVLASTMRMRRFALDVHRRQGLLALAHDEPILDKLTLSVLRREGVIRPDGVVTEAGRAHVGKALLDERRRDIVRQMEREAGTPRGANPLVPLEDVLTRDELGAIDAQLPGPRVVK